MTRFGLWAQQLSTGIPIALAILVAMYLFVGLFGAIYLVDLLNNKIFTGILTPLFEAIVEPIPSAFVRSALVDPDFGVLTTGLFLAFGIVMPVMLCFYLFFGVLEESGYLPRFSVLLQRLMKRIGLNGKGVIPLVMGFSCVTMALLTTRMLDSRKQRLIASLLLILVLPCAPLLAVMLVILAKMPWYASVFVFGFLLLQTMVVGSAGRQGHPGRPRGADARASSHAGAGRAEHPGHDLAADLGFHEGGGAPLPAGRVPGLPLRLRRGAAPAGARRATAHERVARAPGIRGAGLHEDDHSA